LLSIANTINIAADLGAMADATKLLIGGPVILHVVLLGTLSVLAQIFFDYNRYVTILKWLTLCLFAYFIALAVVQVPWRVAITIAIIMTTAATLHAKGITDIQSSAQAAQALKPVAGAFAELVFALGIVGTGLLAIPVLAGSTAYAIGEGKKWPVGLARKPKHA